jgi:hypothetical protein
MPGGSGQGKGIAQYRIAKLQPNILGHQLNETNTQAHNGSGHCCQYRFFKLELSI